jgi:hypothetical protein
MYKYLETLKNSHIKGRHSKKQNQLDLEKKFENRLNSNKKPNDCYEITQPSFLAFPSEEDLPFKRLML